MIPPGKYRLRSGEIVTVTGGRDAIQLYGKGSEWIYYGKFSDGSLCAWNANGTYRASSGRVKHPLDIVGEA